MGSTITLLLTKRKTVVIKAEKSLVLVLNMLIICLWCNVLCCRLNGMIMMINS